MKKKITKQRLRDQLYLKQRHKDQLYSKQRHKDQLYSKQRHKDQLYSKQRHMDQLYSKQRHKDQLYGCTTWTLTKRLEKKLDGNYTRMLRAILNKSWQQHPTRRQLCGHLPPITKTIHCGGARGVVVIAEWKWTRRYEFKSWTILIAFHIALIPLGKVWIQLFSLQLWVNSRTD